MFYLNTTFIGIDPTAGGRPLTYAALDDELNLLALGRGDMEEVLAFVAGQRAALLAVCSPRRPNQGLMEREEVRARLSPQPRPGRWRGFRLAEYQLRQHHITIPRTPADENECPAWMRRGFAFYHRLEGLDFTPYSVPVDSASESSAGSISTAPSQPVRQYLEVYPHGSFTVLLERPPLPKTSLEGRLQRQLVLYEYRLNIPDPMQFFEEITRYRLLHGILPFDGLRLPGELDALVAAYTAWVAGTKPDQITLLGDPEEGWLVLPVTDLKDRY
jgi:hypothetical protein